MIPALLAIAGGVLVDIVKSDNETQKSITDSYNRRDVAINNSNNQKKVNLTKTLIEGAVALAPVALEAYKTYRQTKTQQPQLQTAQSYSELPPEQIQMLSAPELKINYDTVWVNRSTNEMGADVVDESTGQISKFKYRVQSVGNKVHRVFESIDDSQWYQVGIIDWKRMRPADIGTDETGGFIFGEIMRSAMKSR